MIEAVEQNIWASVHLIMFNDIAVKNAAELCWYMDSGICSGKGANRVKPVQN